MHGAHAAGISRLKQLANDAADDGMGAVVGAVAAQPTWADYLPLGQRNTHWPPRVVTRSSRSSSYAVPEANFDECLRHMLQLAGLAVPLPGSLNLSLSTPRATSSQAGAGYGTRRAPRGARWRINSWRRASACRERCARPRPTRPKRPGAAQARERLRRRGLLRPFKGQPVAVPQCALDREV